MEATQGLSRPVRDTSAAPSHFEAAAHFESLFHEHFARVFGILRRIVGERSLAQDLANEVFWKLYTSDRALLEAGNVSAWLYRTATRAGIDAIRASNRRNRYEQRAASGVRDEACDGNQLADLLRAEERAKVQAVLSRMKPARAQIVLLRAEGASYREIADILGVAFGSVGTLLSRAEAEFRDRYLNMTVKKERL